MALHKGRGPSQHRPEKMKAEDYIDKLVIAALDMCDCKDLTPGERSRAERIYDEVGQLESLVQDRAEKLAAIRGLK
jgi:hypothetical protein